MVIRSYRDLLLWQKALELVDAVYDAVRALPVDERFGLASQMVRAAVSVPANVAEGGASGYRRMFLRHLAIARGSLAELETYLEICRRRHYITPENHTRLVAAADEISRMTAGLVASLRKT